MEDYRSKSYKNKNHVHDRQIVNYNPNQQQSSSNFNDTDSKSYSTSTYDQTKQTQLGYYNDSSKKENFSTGWSSSSSPSSVPTKSWVFSDPEFQRKKRVASYKAYAVEGRMKGTFKKSFRWLKDKYTHVRYGWF